MVAFTCAPHFWHQLIASGSCSWEFSQFKASLFEALYKFEGFSVVIFCDVGMNLFEILYGSWGETEFAYSVSLSFTISV